MKLLSTLILGLLLSIPAYAQDAGTPEAEGPEPLIIGVYTPWVHFPNSIARNQYAEGVARALQDATGIPMRGRGFTGSGQFGSAGVDFGIVDAQVQIQRGFKPLAQGAAGGKARRAMAMVVGPKVGGRTIGALKGKSLAQVQVGRADQQFITNFLLQGQVEASYFKKGRKTRDVQGAVSLVKLGRADAAFTFTGATAGLATVLRTRPVPLPVFVQVDGSLPKDTVSKVRSAITGIRVKNAAFDGFTGFDSGKLATLAGALKSGLSRPGNTPITATIRGQLPPVPAFLKTGKVPLILPPVGPDLVVPEPPTDSF